MKRLMIGLVLMPFLLGASVAVAKDVTLTLYVRAGGSRGPALAGASVTCKDAAGRSLSGVTGGGGFVTLTGTPGRWQFIASRAGYRSETWSQTITTACTRHAFLQPMAPPPLTPTPQPPAQPPTTQRQPTRAQTEARTREAPNAPAPAVPAAPTPVSPGRASGSGAGLDTLTPTLQWPAVPGAVSYAVGISKYPYGSSNLVWNPQSVTGTSVRVPAGILQPGMKYRWNMQARSAAGQLSPLSATLCFQTAVLPAPVPATPAAPPAPSVAAPPTPATPASSAPPTRSSPKEAPSAPASLAPAVATLRLHVRDGSATGPALQGVRVTGKDGAGEQFNQTTDAGGCATLAGAPGTWQLALSMDGYQGLAGTIAIRASARANLVLKPMPQTPQPAAQAAPPGVPGASQPPPSRGTVAAPEFDLSTSGNTSVVIRISCATSQATVRYTVDGRDPTWASPVLGNSSLTLRQSVVLKAKATKNGLADSDVSELRLNLLNVPVERQKGNSCFRTSALMVLGYYGVAVSDKEATTYLPDYNPVTVMGPTISDVAAALRTLSNGMVIGAVESTSESTWFADLRSEIVSGHPPIVRVNDYTKLNPKSSVRIGHFFVVRGVAESQVGGQGQVSRWVLYNDPLGGRFAELAYGGFQGAWSSISGSQGLTYRFIRTARVKP